MRKNQFKPLLATSLLLAIVTTALGANSDINLDQVFNSINKLHKSNLAAKAKNEDYIKKYSLSTANLPRTDVSLQNLFSEHINLDSTLPQNITPENKTSVENAKNIATDAINTSIDDSRETINTIRQMHDTIVSVCYDNDKTLSTKINSDNKKLTLVKGSGIISTTIGIIVTSHPTAAAFTAAGAMLFGGSKDIAGLFSSDLSNNQDVINKLETKFAADEGDYTKNYGDLSSSINNPQGIEALAGKLYISLSNLQDDCHLMSSYVTSPVKSGS